MASSSPINSSRNSPRTLSIFSSHISCEDVNRISAALKRTYGAILSLSSRGELDLPREAYNPQRGQYHADLLITSLLKQKADDYALWVIPQDLYTRNMNFIFGLALFSQGSVLSLFRLHTNDLKEKEAIHEIGHVLGLPHCINPCVMHYSNSLGEAQHKPQQLCERCRRLLNI